ncbi:dTDP-4-dehydrorhamnose 3,5-epimerase [Massilia sp. CCM 8733]|uniref:dTDP-4-dehydrorhamnose 3,5-epimerase n=1 Tax=Massilia mucilaginosa TaxID=2609282 RepID=A0ABX0NZ56_9BURK|nr:dTDP-4-dehydrorhamnose 3,5-epimerase family protein [Massilia mucilaginosa]NHZ92026.1 dTDP-4-dehydrorhamnose 3,5-epimerase [Massilia mucilaginosa]
MRFTPTPLAGAFLIDIDPVEDARGLFARTVCEDEFARHGLVGRFVQQSVSWNPQAGTVRGLHFQIAPDQEIKLVRVTRGAIFDAIVDLRPDSATFGKAFHTELSAENRRQLYIPAGMAHGFQSLHPGTEVLYQMSTPFRPASARGLRWDDAALAIPWPACAAGTARTISDNDRAWPLLAALT